MTHLSLEAVIEACRLQREIISRSQEPDEAAAVDEMRRLHAGLGQWLAQHGQEPAAGADETDDDDGADDQPEPGPSESEKLLRQLDHDVDEFIVEHGGSRASAARAILTAGPGLATRFVRARTAEAAVSASSPSVEERGELERALEEAAADFDRPQQEPISKSQQETNVMSSAWQDVERLADAMIAKSEGTKPSRPQAIEAVLASRPDLGRRYEQERAQALEQGRGAEFAKSTDEASRRPARVAKAGSGALNKAIAELQEQDRALRAEIKTEMAKAGIRAQLADRTPAEAEIDRLADALIQKSAGDGKKLNAALAWNKVVELHPELGKRYDLEKSQRAAKTVI